LTIKLTPYITECRSLRSPAACAAAGNLCCYPSDIQLSKISELAAVFTAANECHTV
jgi:hypothetical protein